PRTAMISSARSRATRRPAAVSGGRRGRTIVDRSSSSEHDERAGRCWRSTTNAWEPPPGPPTLRGSSVGAGRQRERTAGDHEPGLVRVGDELLMGDAEDVAERSPDRVHRDESQPDLIADDDDRA